MPKIVCAILFLGSLIWCCPALARADQTFSPQQVIARLVTNAAKNPPGDVEADVTDQTISTAKNVAKHLPDALPAHEGIAAGFRSFTIEGPLNSLYADSLAALFYCKTTLTKEALAEQKEDEVADNPPGFGDGGGFSDFIGPKSRDDGQAIATFCLVLQHGQWKVHGVYLSNDVVAGDSKDFIIRQLTAFSKKS